MPITIYFAAGAGLTGRGLWRLDLGAGGDARVPVSEIRMLRSIPWYHNALPFKYFSAIVDERHFWPVVDLAAATRARARCFGGIADSIVLKVSLD